MHASRKIASSALLVLVLAGAAGCAPAGDDAAGDGASLAAAEADLAPMAPEPAQPGDSGRDVVIVNINSNDHLGFHHGGHGGHHHGCGGAAAATVPLAPPPSPPPPPPPDQGQPG